MIISALDMLDGQKDTQEEICNLYRRKFDAITEEVFHREATEDGELEFFAGFDYPEFRGKVSAALDEVVLSMLHGSREAGDIECPHTDWHGKPTWLFATGGMSWGDSPTELSGAIEMLFYAGIADLTPEEAEEIWLAVAPRRGIVPSENDYRVAWVIDIPAGSPQEAAEKALEIQRDPESWATVFEVTDYRGKTTEIDLMGDDEE